MNRLWIANIMRMVKNKLFWLAIVFMSLVSIGFPIMNYMVMIKNDFPLFIDNSFFMGTMFIGILLSIFCSLFIGTEYNDGVIRNKIIVGKNRIAIYFSNLLTCILAGILMCFVSLISCFIVGIPLLGAFQSEISVIIRLAICMLLLSVSFASIYTFITMIIPNKATSAVICLLTAFLFLGVSTYISARLNEPKVYDEYVYMNESGQMKTEKAEPNPNYVSGTKRELYEFINEFLPGGQSFKIAQMSSESPERLMIYSIVIIVLTTGAGVWIFKKKDLK